jgi:hypothetical protein
VRAAEGRIIFLEVVRAIPRARAMTVVQMGRMVKDPEMVI